MPHMDGPAPQARRWGKSTFSTNGGDCVEAAIHADGVDLRHSKHPDGPTLRFTPDEYVAYYLGIINEDPNVTPPAVDTGLPGLDEQLRVQRDVLRHRLLQPRVGALKLGDGGLNSRTATTGLPPHPASTIPAHPAPPPIPN